MALSMAMTSMSVSASAVIPLDETVTVNGEEIQQSDIEGSTMGESQDNTDDPDPEECMLAPGELIPSVTEDVFGELTDSVTNKLLELPESTASDLFDALDEAVSQDRNLMEAFFQAALDTYTDETETDSVLTYIREYYLDVLSEYPSVDQEAAKQSIDAGTTYTEIQDAFYLYYGEALQEGGQQEGTDTGEQEGIGGNEGQEGTGDDGTGEETDSALEAKKQEALKQLQDAGSQVPAGKEAERDEILTEATTMIQGAATEEEVASALENAKTKLAGLTQSAELSTEINKAIEELELIDLTALDSSRLAEAQAVIEAAKSNLQTCTTAEQITQLLSDAKNQVSALISAQVVDTQRTAALEGLEQYYNSLTFAVDELKEAAEQEYAKGVAAIQAASTEADITKALEETKDALSKISTGTEESLEMLREDAVKTVTEVKDSIRSSADIAEKAYSFFYKELQAADTPEKIVSPKNNGLNLMNALKKAINESDPLSCGETISFLKVYTSGTEIKSLLDYLSITADGEKFADAKERIEDAVKAIQLNDIEAVRDYLTDKLKNIASVVSEDKQEEIDAAIEDFTRKAEGDSLRDAYKLYLETEEKINDILGSDELSKVKLEAIAELDKFLDGVKDSELKGKINDIILEAEVSIESAKTEAQIEAILEKAQDAVDELKKEFEQEAELEKKRESAKAQIDKLINGVSDADLRTILKPIAESAKADIDRAESESEISAVITQIKKDITQATSEYSKDKALLQKKTQTIEKLENLTDGKILSTELSVLLTNAKNDIMNATTSSEVDNIYNTTAQTFNKIYLEDLREEYNAKLDSLLSGSGAEGETLAKIQEVVTKAKSNINKASNLSVIENIYNQAQSAIQLLNQNATSNLDDIKAQAISELENYTPLNTTSAKKVIAAYTNKINNATTADEITTYLQEGKSLLQRLNDAAGVTSETASNSSLVNPNTSTSKYGDTASAQAMAKGGLEETSMVKTGDENGKSIVVNAIAAVIGIGAVVALIVMKIRKKK